MARGLLGGSGFWLATIVGLSGLIAFEFSDDLPLTPTVIAAANDASVGDAWPSSPSTVKLPLEGHIDDIVSRPLFSPSRRPAVTVVPTEKPVETGEQSLTLELIGTMLAGELPIALLRHPTDGLMRLRQGQEVGEWTISDIQDARVSLENGDRTETLMLRKDRIKPVTSGSIQKKDGIAKPFGVGDEEPSNGDQD